MLGTDTVPRTPSELLPQVLPALTRGALVPMLSSVSRGIYVNIKLLESPSGR